MNIFDAIVPNPFLNSIYPNGLMNDILIGQIEFDSGGHVWLTIHTKESPYKIIKKWGIFGKDYNIVVIKLSICDLKRITVSGWSMADFFPVEIEKKGDIFVIRQSSGKYDFEVQAAFLNFKNCSVYVL